MATATCQLSEDQFLCCICLDVFTNPTSLSCGHSFCKKCIERNWAEAVIYKCPYCKQIFEPKPELKVNIFISEMATHFKQSIKRKAGNRSAQQAAKPGEIPCDVCPEPKLKALKSCLVCLTSYCDSHLKPHLSVPALKKHELIEPRENLEEKLCPQHSKPLELFCKNDELCICVLCAYSDHNTHEVVPLKDISEQKKLQLGRTQANIEKMILAKQMKIQDLRHSVEISNTSADREITEGVKAFNALKECVDRGLESLFQEISRKQTATEEQAEGLIKELEQEISELKRRSSEVEQVSRSDDHLHLLQHLSQLRSTPRTKDWTNVSICPPTYEGTVVRALSELEQEFNKTTKDLTEAELKRVKGFETLVSLDGDTAHPQLVVSQNGAQVNYSIEQRTIRNSPNRFDDLFVLGRQSFSKRFYFEAEVRGKTEWTLGVAKESVNRKGTLTLNPQNGFWTIGLKNNTYFASANPEVYLQTKSKPEKVGVFVDYDEGRVSFYDFEAAALIYSFSGFTFKEKLFPICSPGHYSYGNFSPLVMCQNMPPRIKWPMKWPTVQ